LNDNAGKLALAKAKTYDLDPRTDGAAWNAVLTNAEVAILNHGNLNNAQKVYQAGLLISHLRHIKTAGHNEALDVTND
jgi:hypothetical protein